MVLSLYRLLDGDMFNLFINYFINISIKDRFNAKQNEKNYKLAEASYKTIQFSETLKPLHKILT